MDQLLFEAIGIHFLEPQVSFSEKYKVKPAMTKQKKPGAEGREAHSYMKPKSKKPAADVQSEASGKLGAAQLSAAAKRALDLEVKPKINLALKLQVTKKDLKARPLF